MVWDADGICHCGRWCDTRADMGSYLQGIVILIDKHFLSVADHLLGQRAAVTAVGEAAMAPCNACDSLRMAGGSCPLWSVKPAWWNTLRIYQLLFCKITCTWGRIRLLLMCVVTWSCWRLIVIDWSDEQSSHEPVFNSSPEAWAVPVTFLWPILTFMRWENKWYYNWPCLRSVNSVRVYLRWTFF